jgi:hypothetical protein
LRSSASAFAHVWACLHGVRDACGDEHQIREEIEQRHAREIADEVAVLQDKVDAERNIRYTLYSLPNSCTEPQRQLTPGRIDSLYHCGQRSGEHCIYFVWVSASVTDAAAGSDKEEIENTLSTTQSTPGSPHPFDVINAVSKVAPLLKTAARTGAHTGR